MKKLEQLYEGKAKKVFATDDPNVVLVDYKDDATAFNGLKKGTIMGKGVINNRVTNFLMKMLEKNGIPDALRRRAFRPRDAGEEGSHRAAGGHCAQYRRRLRCPSASVCPKARNSSRPCWNTATRTTSWATRWSTSTILWRWAGSPKSVLDQIAAYALRINELLTAYLKEVNIELIDFKLEFGITNDGQLVLADEISPDTCRFWDTRTGEKLDKDRFRRDLGNVEDAYIEIRKRLMGE